MIWLTKEFQKFSNIWWSYECMKVGMTCFPNKVG